MPATRGLRRRCTAVPEAQCRRKRRKDGQAATTASVGAGRSRIGASVRGGSRRLCACSACCALAFRHDESTSETWFACGRMFAGPAIERLCHPWHRDHTSRAPSAIPHALTGFGPLRASTWHAPSSTPAGQERQARESENASKSENETPPNSGALPRTPYTSVSSLRMVSHKGHKGSSSTQRGVPLVRSLWLASADVRKRASATSVSAPRCIRHARAASHLRRGVAIWEDAAKA
jgi:hypothetical protein